jgi:hypothetical protein
MNGNTKHKISLALKGGNSTSFKKGQTKPKGAYAFKKGYKPTEEHRRKVSESHSEERNWNWKGNNAGYSALHDWVRKWKGKPEYCEMCGTTIAKKYEWANIDHKYRRILDDYIRVCTSCHRIYDRNNNYEQY